MKIHLNRWTPQPLIAIIVSILTLLILIESWHDRPPLALDAGHIQDGLIALFLAAAVISAGLYPIHLRHNVKVLVTTVPIYVAAMLLPPAVAALTAGASTLLLQLLTRSRHGNTPSDMATATGRWVIVAFISSWVAQRASTDHWPAPLVLLSVAAVMFTCDVITGTLEIAPMTGEPPRRMIPVLVREASLTEGAQYLLGILAVLGALQQAWSLVLWVLPLYISYRSFKYAKEMQDSTGRLLEGLADAVDLRDPYTGGHSRRVTELSLHILREMHITGPEVELIRAAARVHDIGKIGIPDQILDKPGKLTPEEKSIMDSHPERGAELLARYKDFVRGVEIVRHHHERWDGAGYPAGLKGLDIPFGARVIAVADSFDAMTSDRPYRMGMTTSQAVQILRNGRDQQWESMIVDAFLRYLEKTQAQVMTPGNAAVDEMVEKTQAQVMTPGNAAVDEMAVLGISS